MDFLMVLLFIMVGYSMVITMVFQRKLDRERQKNEIYKKHWLDLCDEILRELDKDGWCRLVMTREQALNMKEKFESFN